METPDSDKIGTLVEPGSQEKLCRLTAACRSRSSVAPGPRALVVRGASATGNHRSRSGFIASGVALFCFAFVAATSAQDTKRVLVIYPVNDRQPGITAFEQGLRLTCQKASTDRIEFYNEYLDSARFPDEGYQNRLAEFLKGKYAGRRIDVIVAALAPSLDFILKYRSDIFPGVPVIHSAIEAREVAVRRLPPDVIGVSMAIELEPTLELALRLHPKTDRVFVIAGSSKSDAYWAQEARQAFRGYESRVKVQYLTGLPMSDLIREVAHIPEGSLIFYLHVFQDGKGQDFVPAEAAERICSAAHVPVYGCVSTYLGRGVLGGRMFSFETEGEKAARLILPVLAGEQAENIQVREAGANLYMFDWRQLRRWDLTERELPSGSVVLFKTPTLWDAHKWQIVGVGSLCVVEGLLIIGLLVERANRRQADERFRNVVRAAPNGLIMMDQHGKISLVNEQTEAIFGYQEDELLGRPVEMLVPQSFRGEHAALGANHDGAPTSRSMGGGRDLCGKRKDGTEFPMEVGLSPIRTPTGPTVLATVIDITERRRAEDVLRTSQQELRTLTGRLLRAQETERRRIALELHDDLNQSLALLAVELDILAQKPPEIAAQLAARLRKLTKRVRELSSYVHDLSHQLHPAKLEQLGLAGAIRGLCGELGHNYGLEIAYSDLRLPRAVPEEIALCVYRIAQEGLRNVVKHSGARHASVELSCTNQVIFLRIADNGSGFDPAALNGHEGLGLISMRERLRLVGGFMNMESRPGRGMRIEVSIPLSESAADEPQQPSVPSAPHVGSLSENPNAWDCHEPPARVDCG